MNERKVLTEWPTHLPPEELAGRWEYRKNGEVMAGRFMPVDSAYRWLFRSDDGSAIVWGIVPGECFVPVEGEAPLDEVSTLRARVAELETSLDEAVNVEGGLYDKIEHSLLTALGFPGTIDEAIAETKRLRDLVKEVEKIVGESPSPRDVRIALGKLPAPLRLGRGPTLEEVREHEPAGGHWMLRSDDSGRWDEWTVTSSTFTALLFDGRTGLTLEDFNDAIPLNAARQPCRVGG